MNLDEDEKWEKISLEAKDLLKELLHRDPSKRITTEDALSHPWFKDMNRETAFCDFDLMSLIPKKLGGK